MMPAIAAVPGKELVAAIPGQGHSYLLTRQLTDLVRRHGRAVREGFVVERHEIIDEVEGIRIDLPDVMGRIRTEEEGGEAEEGAQGNGGRPAPTA